MPAQMTDTLKFYQKRLMPMRHTTDHRTLRPAGSTSSLPALAQPIERQLANGLRVIVKEDRRAPTVAHMVWYRAGSMDETNGTTGVAHVLEHMMFKGTPTIGPASSIAWSPPLAGATTRSPAAITPPISAGAEREAIRDDAARSRPHASSDARRKEFAQEIKVVMEERRLRTDDQPQALL
jgi:zinc protease